MHTEASHNTSCAALSDVFLSHFNALLILDNDGSIINLNAAFARIWDLFDVPLNRSLSFSENLETVARIPRYQSIAQTWLTAMTQPADTELAPLLHMPNGRIFKVSALNTENNRKLVSCRDVTDAQSRKTALRQSEYRYRLLVETISEGLVMLDHEHRITYANPRFVTFYGSQAKDIIGQALPDLVILGARQRLNKRLTEGAKESEEFPLVCHDGSTRFVMISSALLHNPDGTPTGSFATITDVTPLRSASAQQHKSEERFRNIIANTPFGILTLDIDGQILSANPAFLNMIKCNDQSITLSSIQNWLPDMDPTLHKMMEQLQTQTEENSTTALSHLCSTENKNGRARLVLSKIGDYNECYLLVVEDISEQHAMEEALLHTSKLALLGEMSASMAHEISQPLNIIRLAAENALMSLDVEKSPFMREKLETITSQSERLRQTVNHMQTFSRRDTGPQRHFDLRNVTQATLSMLTPRCNSLGIRISEELPNISLPILGQPRHLEQVLLNLCHNAVDAIVERRNTKPDQSDLITISAETLTKTPDRTEIMIRVTDTGTGVWEEDLPLLFNPFFTRKTEEAGTGLGLSISLGLVNNMGGEITAENRPEGGCCFCVTVPLSTDTAPSLERQAPQTVLPPTTHSDKPKMTVMVADDEPLALREISSCLEQAKHSVIPVQCGSDAKEILRKTHVDVVITDLQMPNGDGYDLIAEIAAEYPHIGIIVTTGQPLRDRIKVAKIESGADAILHKPISLKELIDTLEALA